MGKKKRSYCIAQETVVNLLEQTMMKKNIKKNVSLYFFILSHFAVGRNQYNTEYQQNFNFIYFLFVFVFSRAAPAAHGGSQAKGRIGAVAASLHHSRSNAGSELRLQPTPQLRAASDP